MILLFFQLIIPALKISDILSLSSYLFSDNYFLV